MTLALLLCTLWAPSARAAAPAWQGWRAQLAEEAAQAAAADPALAELVHEIQPGVTRIGVARLVDERLETPLATPLLLERALDERDPGLRRALLDAAERARGEWAVPMAGLLVDDPDPAVRALAAGLLDDAAPGPAEALRFGARDSSPLVRAAAQRAIGGREDGAAYADELKLGLGDPSAAVRLEAARSAGWLGQTALYDDLRPLLSDADAGVRLEALNATARLDPARLAQEPALNKLKADPDPRVARAAASRATTQGP